MSNQLRYMEYLHQNASVHGFSMINLFLKNQIVKTSKSILDLRRRFEYTRDKFQQIFEKKDQFFFWLSATGNTTTNTENSKKF